MHGLLSGALRGRVTPRLLPLCCATDVAFAPCVPCHRHHAGAGADGPPAGHWGAPTALAALVALLSISWRGGPAARQLPACSLPDFAAGERAEGCHPPPRCVRTWQRRISPWLLGAGLLRDVRHRHLVPRASVSPPGDIGPWGQMPGLGRQAGMWVGACVGPPQPHFCPRSHICHPTPGKPSLGLSA